MMQDLNYWKQFEHTGKVEDYLSYCACITQEHNGGKNAFAAENGQEQSGVNPYAGYSLCNRNSIETNAYR